MQKNIPIIDDGIGYIVRGEESHQEEGFVIFLDALGMKGIWEHYSFRDVEKCYSLLYGLLAAVSIESKCNVSF